MSLPSRITNAARATLASSLLALLGAASPAFAQNTPSAQEDLQSLRDQIRQLDQKIQAIEQREQAQAQAAASAAASHPLASSAVASAASPPPPVITANPTQGFSIASADGAYSLRIRALAQADSHWFFNQAPAITNNDAFLIRRARLWLEGTLDTNTTFRVLPEFAGNAPTLLEAWGNVAVTPEVQFKFGRMVTPVGLEQLQPDAVGAFDERSFVSEIVPFRDIGAVVWGEVLDGTLSYAVGAFDGVPDGQNNGAVSGTAVNSDADNDKDIVARIFWQPFKNQPDSALQGLGFGIAGTAGREKPGSGLAGYKSESQQTIFTYRSTTVIDGKTDRITPQAYYYHGSFSLFGEYAASSINARPIGTGSAAAPNGISEQLTNQAWELTAGYVLTGEKATYAGVTPKTNFNWANGTWGAFQVVARYDVLDLDPKAFAPDPLSGNSLADPAASTRKETNFGLGLNWFLNRSVRFNIDFFHGHFDNEVRSSSLTNNVLKNDENGLLTRLQIYF